MPRITRKTFKYGSVSMSILLLTGCRFHSYLSHNESSNPADLYGQANFAKQTASPPDDKQNKDKTEQRGTRNEDGQKLMNALYKKDTALLKSLLDAGADPDCPNLEDGYYVLLAAAAGSIEDQPGASERVRLLLEKGANPNVTDSYGRSSLWWASSVGNVQSVQLLLAHHARVNAGDTEGTTPLMEAAEVGHNDVITILLRHGAKIDAKHGYALVIAASKGNLSTVKLLLRSGANIHINDKNGYYNALIAATEKGRADVVAYLIRSGVNVNVQDDDGDTALHAAQDMGFDEIETLLKKAGAKI